MSALRAEDVRLAFRRLRKHPGPTMASIAALACGIGAAVATWSLLTAVLVSPLPVAEPDRLFQIDAARPAGATVAPAFVGFICLKRPISTCRCMPPATSIESGSAPPIRSDRVSAGFGS